MGQAGQTRAASAFGWGDRGTTQDGSSFLLTPLLYIRIWSLSRIKTNANLLYKFATIKSIDELCAYARSQHLDAEPLEGHAIG